MANFSNYSKLLIRKWKINAQNNKLTLFHHNDDMELLNKQDNIPKCKFNDFSKEIS